MFERKDIEEEEFLRTKDEYTKIKKRFDDSRSGLLSLGLMEFQIEMLIKKHETFMKNLNFSDLNEQYLSIISPISGTIIFRDGIIGERIEPGKIFYTVSDLSSLWALFDVNIKDLKFIKIGNAIRIKSLLYPDKEFKGKITYVSDKIDEKLRTLRVRVEVINKHRLLKANMLVFGTIENNNF